MCRTCFEREAALREARNRDLTDPFAYDVPTWDTASTTLSHPCAACGCAEATGGGLCGKCWDEGYPFVRDPIFARLQKADKG